MFYGKMDIGVGCLGLVVGGLRWVMLLLLKVRSRLLGVLRILVMVLVSGGCYM